MLWSDEFGWNEHCNGDVRAIAVASDGTVYVGGTFRSCGTVVANNVARFDPASGEWSALGSAGGNGIVGYDIVNALHLLGDDLYVGGRFTEVNAGNPVAANNIARWDGTRWHALGSQGGNGVGDAVLALAGHGSDLYVGGSFFQANVGNPISAFSVARWNGSSWSSLGSHGNNGVSESVYSLAVYGDELCAGGRLWRANIATTEEQIVHEVPVHGFACWNGSAWRMLGMDDGLEMAQGSVSRVSAMAVRDGSLYLAGSFSLGRDGEPPLARNIARWNGHQWLPLGHDDGEGTDGSVQTLTVSESGLYVVGSFSQVNVGNPIASSHVARWDGDRWSPIHWESDRHILHEIHAIADFDGGVLVGGALSERRPQGGTWKQGIGLWDGETFASLGTGEGLGADGSVLALLRSGNHFYVGGRFTRVGGVAANNIARLDLTDGTWSPLGVDGGNGVDGSVLALAMLDGELYLGGSFLNANEGQPLAVNHIVRWTGDAWVPVGSGGGNGVNGGVSALEVFQGSLYVGGGFDSANTGAPIAANSIARWDGQSWFPVGHDGGNGLSSAPGVMASTPEGLIVGGEFHSANVGQDLDARGIARWDGMHWHAFDADPNALLHRRVQAITYFNNEIIIGGQIEYRYFIGNIEGQTSMPIARWDGNRWQPLQPSIWIHAEVGVTKLLVHGNRLIVGGSFHRVPGSEVEWNALASWNGQRWSALGSGVDGYVSDLALGTSDALYVGGSFLTAGGKGSRNLARYRLMNRLDQNPPAVSGSKSTERSGSDRTPLPRRVAADMTGSASAASKQGHVADLRVSIDGVVEPSDGAVDGGYVIEVHNAGPNDAELVGIRMVASRDNTENLWTCAARAGGSCGQPSGAGWLSTTVALKAGGSVSFVQMARVGLDHSPLPSVIVIAEHAEDADPPVEDPDYIDNAATYMGANEQAKPPSPIRARAR